MIMSLDLKGRLSWAWMMQGVHETQIAAEHIRHARKLNVLLVRTIDLLYLMRHLEAESERRAKVLGLLRSGGGWLSAGPAGYELVPG